MKRTKKQEDQDKLIQETVNKIISTKMPFLYAPVIGTMGSEGSQVIIGKKIEDLKKENEMLQDEIQRLKNELVTTSSNIDRLKRKQNQLLTSA